MVKRYLSKSIGNEHGITPNFMAKPAADLPGNSGHIHISLTDLAGINLFSRDVPDTDAAYPDMIWISDLGRSFIAGLLEALPDILVLLAPTINSYKRLVENFWAPVFVSWGLEDRIASLRVIAPPTCKPSATRIEVRVPGADLPPHYAIAAIILAGWRGVQKKMELTAPPMSRYGKDNLPPRLPNDLSDAVNSFAADNSIARELFGDAFVDHFAGTRRHEIGLYKRVVTDW
jgi:glutamine synthetase